MIGVAQSIREGSIIVRPGFLSTQQFKELEKKILDYEYTPTHQPPMGYGNRFQAYPCYESGDLWHIDRKTFEVFKEKIQKLLEDTIVGLQCMARRTVIEEVKQSAAKEKYGIVHRDTDVEFAFVFQFAQSFNAGTAFFENFNDKLPDIEISAYRNRLILYNAQRWHAPCTDFTFKERYIISGFIRTEKW